MTTYLCIASGHGQLPVSVDGTWSQKPVAEANLQGTLSEPQRGFSFQR